MLTVLDKSNWEKMNFYIVERNEGRPNENERRLFIQRLL